MNSRCQNPCAISNICNPDQECRVLDTLPLRTVMCQCPPDTVADITGHCRAIIPDQPQCHVDGDCSDRDKCIKGRCIEACKVDSCGINAQCNSIHHQALCTCPHGFIGNPHLECNSGKFFKLFKLSCFNFNNYFYLEPIYPPVVLVPECYTNSDCTYDKRCKNSFCVNPCVQDKPCAIGAFCSVNNHQPICVCPAGYEGNPRVECLPRKNFNIFF